VSLFRAKFRYLACSDVSVTTRQIVLGYRLRWAVELFHKEVKQNLGFEDVATSGFDSVKAGVIALFPNLILKPHWCRPYKPSNCQFSRTLPLLWNEVFVQQVDKNWQFKDDFSLFVEIAM
jgi:Transposase DDE domain